MNKINDTPDSYKWYIAKPSENKGMKICDLMRLHQNNFNCTAGIRRLARNGKNMCYAFDYESPFEYYISLADAYNEKKPYEVIYMCRVVDDGETNYNFPILYFRVSKAHVKHNMEYDKALKSKYYLNAHIRKLYLDYYYTVRDEKCEQEYLEEHKFHFTNHVAPRRVSASILAQNEAV